MEPRWLDISEIKNIFSQYDSYKGIDEMRSGMYLREYTALNELIKRRLLIGNKYKIPVCGGE